MSRLERFVEGGRVVYRMKEDRPDLAFMEICEGVTREILESRVRVLVAEVRKLEASEEALTEALTSVQRVSTRQCGELRVHRALSVLADTPEGAFLAEALHELSLARAKYPWRLSTAHMVNVLAEESGEVARALVHGEGAARVRAEAAQVVGACVRLAVESLSPAQSPPGGCAHENAAFLGSTASRCRECGALKRGRDREWELAETGDETRLRPHG